MGFLADRQSAELNRKCIASATTADVIRRLPICSCFKDACQAGGTGQIQPKVLESDPPEEMGSTGVGLFVVLWLNDSSDGRVRTRAMDLPYASRAASEVGGATRWPNREHGQSRSPTSAPSDLAQALRAATRGLHHVIDHHSLLAPLVRDGVTRQQYGRALRALLWLYEPLQWSLAARIAEFGGGYDLADRVSWLRIDLAFLGISADLPADAWAAPIPASPAGLAGMLYVVEGSMLGGQVIARQLAAGLGVGTATGARFFNGWGDETADLWQAFCAHAARLTGDRRDEACSAAVELFEALLRGFDAAQRWMDEQCN